MIPFTQEIDTPGLSASLRPGAGRSQSGTSLNPSPRYSEASDFFSQKSVYVCIRIAQVAVHFYPRKRKKKLPSPPPSSVPVCFHWLRRSEPGGIHPFAQSSYRRLGAASVLVSRYQTQVACLRHSPLGRRFLRLPAPLQVVDSDPRVSYKQKHHL